MSTHYSIIYTTKANVKRNNRDVSQLQKIIKKSYDIDDYSERTYLYAEKWHLTKPIGTFKAGMDVVMINRRLISNKLQLLNISALPDLSYYSPEEISLVQSIRFFYLDTNLDGDYSKEFWDARDDGSIIVEKITEEDDWVLPEEYRSLYNAEFEKATEKVKELNSSDDAIGEKCESDEEREAAKKFSHKQARKAVRAEILKKKLLEHPYLLYSIRQINLHIFSIACQDEEWLTKLVKKDASVLPLLFRKEYNSSFFWGSIGDDIIKSAIKTDYTAFKFIDFIPCYSNNISNLPPEGYDLYLKCVKLLDDDDFIKFVLNEKKRQGVIQEDSISILARASKRIKSNKEIVELAVSIDPREFCYASKKLRQSEDYITNLMEKDYWGIAPGISKKLSTDNFRNKCYSIYCNNHNLKVSESIDAKFKIPSELKYHFAGFDEKQTWAKDGILEYESPIFYGFDFKSIDTEHFNIPNYKEVEKTINELKAMYSDTL